MSSSEEEVHGGRESFQGPTSNLFVNFPLGSGSKEPACNAGDLGSISGLGRSPGKEMATHSSILAWKIPWMEEPGKL